MHPSVVKCSVRNGQLCICTHTDIELILLQKPDVTEGKKVVMAQTFTFSEFGGTLNKIN